MTKDLTPTLLTETRDQHVVTLVYAKPPNNHLDVSSIGALADAFARLDADDDCRVVVLASEGRIFCAGADFASVREEGGAPGIDTRDFYRQAMRLFDFTKPIVAAVQGPSVGAGLGLALACDFRVACPASRFVANFTRLGFHPGFGTSVTLPRLVGAQMASLLLFTGRRVGGEEAARIGLADAYVDDAEVRRTAQALATEIATSASLAVRSTRAALRRGLAERVREANAHEHAMQAVHFATEDFQEGVRAMGERRPPHFRGR